MKIRLLALLMSALMLLSVLAGCNGKSEGTEADSTKTEENGAEVTEGDTQAETKPARVFADLTPVNMEGETFTILTRNAADTNLWKPIDWMGEDDDTDDIPAAVYKRNTRVEETFKCEILHMMDSNYLPEAQAAFLGDTEDYDIIVMPVIQQLGTMAASGYYADLSSLTTMDLEDVWWDGKTNDSLSLLNNY